MSLARFLLIGGLAIAAVALLATAIAVAAPYLALILVISVIIKLMPEDKTEKPPE